MVVGYIFDSVISVGTVDPGQMQDVETSRSQISMSEVEYKAFVRDRYGALDWTPIDPKFIYARGRANAYGTWLYDKSNDELRGGRPVLDAAQAIAPYCEYNLNIDTGAMEYFETKMRVWKRSGGEHILSVSAIAELAQKHIYTFTLRYGEKW